MSVSRAERKALSSAAGQRPAAGAALPNIAHVGYHRTGTNFLQRAVFPRLDAYVFRPQNSGRRFFADPESFDEAATRAYFAAEQAKNTAQRPFLISHERLTGTAERDDLTVAGKLYRLNPDMRIIIVIRSQYDMIRSLYHLHVKRGGTDSYGAFVQRLIAGGRCDYEAMIGGLADCFGRDRVLALLYEDLAEAPERFLQELCAFIGVPAVAAPRDRVNARGSDSVLRVRRFMNEWRADSAGTAGWKGALARIAQAVVLKADRVNEKLGGGPVLAIDAEAKREAIHRCYAAGNRQLAAMLDLPLGDRGYPV